MNRKPGSTGNKKGKTGIKNDQLKSEGNPSTPSTSTSTSTSIYSSSSTITTTLISHLKPHKLSHKSLHSSLTSLSKELALLDQLWYKNQAQFRTAKWWKRLDGVRRCGKRVVGSKGKQSKASKIRSIRDSNSREKGKDSVTNALKAEDPKKGWRDGAGWKSLGNSLHLWQAMWGSREEVEEFKYGPRNTSLPKLPGQPNVKPSQESLELLSSSLKELLVLLHELRLRSRQAWSMISAHLRTPPAPTFAPLCVLLLGICAKIDSLAGEAAWGIDVEVEQDQSSRKEGIQTRQPQKANQLPGGCLLLTKTKELEEALHGKDVLPTSNFSGLSSAQNLKRNREISDDPESNLGRSEDRLSKKVKVSENDEAQMETISKGSALPFKRKKRTRRSTPGHFSLHRSNNALVAILLDSNSSCKTPRDFRGLKDPLLKTLIKDTKVITPKEKSKVDMKEKKVITKGIKSKPETKSKLVTKPKAKPNAKSTSSSTSTQALKPQNKKIEVVKIASETIERTRGAARERRRAMRAQKFADGKGEKVPETSSLTGKKPLEGKKQMKKPVTQVAKKRKAASFLDDDLGEALER